MGWKYNTLEGGVSTGLNIFMVIYLGSLILQGKMTIGEYVKKDKIIIITHDDYMSIYGDKIINLNEE